MLSAVVFRNSSAPMQSDPARNRAVLLDRGIKESGGMRVDVLASMSYNAAAAQIAAALSHQYRVVYARPESLIPPERVTIEGARDGWTVFGAPARGQKER
jgi:hypothetical protein